MHMLYLHFNATIIVYTHNKDNMLLQNITSPPGIPSQSKKSHPLIRFCSVKGQNQWDSPCYQKLRCPRAQRDRGLSPRLAGRHGLHLRQSDDLEIPGCSIHRKGQGSFDPNIFFWRGAWIIAALQLKVAPHQELSDGWFGWFIIIDVCWVVCILLCEFNSFWVRYMFFFLSLRASDLRRCSSSSSWCIEPLAHIQHRLQASLRGLWKTCFIISILAEDIK